MTSLQDIELSLLNANVRMLARKLAAPGGKQAAPTASSAESFPYIPGRNAFEFSSNCNTVKDALARRTKKVLKLSRAKMEGMKPTPVQLFEACDGQKLYSAIEKLAKQCGEDTDVCLDLFDGLLRGGFVEFKCPRGARQTMVSLTSAGKEQLFFERTRVSRKAAHDALAAMDAEE